MGVWRCLISAIIILLIVFPTSELLPIAIANAGILHPQESHAPTWQLPESRQCNNSPLPQFSIGIALTPQEFPTDKGNTEDRSNGFDRSINLLRSLLWRMTRHLQQLPIESWLADLEANVSHKNEEIALEAEMPC